MTSTRVGKTLHTGRCEFRDGVLTSGPREGDSIALTFDVCPTSHVPGFASDLVAILKQEHVAATFFVSGKWARDHPGDLKSLMQDDQFEIALHGDLHRHLTDATPEQVREEIEEGRRSLMRLGVVHPAPYFRPPYGDTPPSLSAVSRASGVTPVNWDAGLGDPDPNRTASVMERDAIRWVQGGSIVVLHANGAGVATAQTVRDLVPLFRSRGYVFVRLSDLAGACGVAEGAADDPKSGR